VILQYQLFIIMLGGLVMNGKLSGRGPIFDGPKIMLQQGTSTTLDRFNHVGFEVPTI